MAYSNPEVQKAYLKKHYAENKQDYIDRSRIANDRRRLEQRKMVWDYLTHHPCVECGESDPIVLEFDHQVPADKHLAISNLVNRAGSIKKLMAEIEKCHVLCANCHRRKTAKQFGYYAYTVQPPL